VSAVPATHGGVRVPGSASPTALLGVDDHMARLANGAILRRAIARRELHCVFQPIVELANATIVGAEALVRWQHPELGRVAPSGFVETAEATGVVPVLGRFVLDEACCAAARWPSGSRGPVPVSVNVSPLQLDGGDLAVVVERALDESGLDPARLVLELTESSEVIDLEGAASQLAEVRARGVAVVLDDLGSGYSSLLRLVRLPVDGVKIDSALVGGVCDDPHAAAVVRSIAALARALEIDAVAEGVETAAQRACLVDLGCTLGQGYYFAKPMPAGAFVARLARVRPRS